MAKDVSESAPAERLHSQCGTLPNHQHDLPDRWCFGLAHPYMQRLIFLAGALERSALDPDLEDCRSSDSQADK